MIKITVILCLISVGLSLAFGYSNQEHVQILRNDREVWNNGYRLAYELSDGQNCYEVGQVVNGDLVVTGSYTYIGLDGLLYFKSYQYVREGFKPYVIDFPLGAGYGGFSASGLPNLMPEKEKEKENETEIQPKLIPSLVG